MNVKTFTSESVSHGHPDKVADQISDALLDQYITKNSSARVAIETMVTTNNVIICGETKGVQIAPDVIEEIVRSTIKKIGYQSQGFHWDKIQIKNLLHEQSEEISCGVDKESGIGAGDQGIMFGYATNETANFMPAPIHYAHKILENIFRSEQGPKLGPDGKSQITLLYQDGVPIKATNIVVSIQHPQEMSQEDIKGAIYKTVEDTLPQGWMCPEQNFLVNPSGTFVIGGPVSDCGLTGRKIIVDTYGGMVPHGGGAFSGKDASKVDRSAAYMARYIAKNIVATGIAGKCLISLAYAIGISDPLSLTIETYNTSKINEDLILKFIQDNVDLSPAGIIAHLGLDQPIYLPTAAYGHFGKIAEKQFFTWEKLDLQLEKLLHKEAV